MIKALFFFAFVILIACTSKVTTTHVETPQDTIAVVNTDVEEPSQDTVSSSKVYGNERFRNVTVTNTEGNTFAIKGQAQIFEANFGWVLEDGHNELQTGNHMTDAGAPEWGNFNFKVTAPKDNPNSTLHVILFESSAQDGSRQYELPILLY